MEGMEMGWKTGSTAYATQYHPSRPRIGGILARMLRVYCSGFVRGEVEPSFVYAGYCILVGVFLFQKMREGVGIEFCM